MLRVIDVAIEDFKRGIAIAIRILTEAYGMQVVFCGTQAFTDGTLLVLPDVGLLARKHITPEEVKEAKRFLMALRGYAWHEAGHVMETEMGCIEEAERVSKMFGRLLNCVEDIREELRIGAEFRGVKEALDFLREKWVYPRIAHGISKDRDNLDSYVSQIFFALQVLIKHQAYKDHVIWKACASEVQDFALRLRDHCLRIRRAANLSKPQGTRRTLEICHDIWNAMREEYKDRADDKSPPVTMAKSRPSKLEKEEGSSEETSELSAGGAENSEVEDKSGSCKSVKSRKDSEDSSKGSESVSKPSEVGDTEGEDKSEKVVPSGDESSEEDESASGTDGSSEDDEEWLVVDPDRIAEVELSHDPDMATAITEEAKRAARHVLEDVAKTGLKPYLVFAPDTDVIRRPHKPSGGAKLLNTRLKQLRDETHRTHGAIKRRLQHLLRVASRSHFMSDLEEGPEIDMASVHKLAAGTSERIFRQKVVRKTLKDTVVGLLIDASASMQYSGSDRLAIQTAFSFGECLNAAKIPFGCWSFTTVDSSTGAERYHTATASERDLYSRWGSLYIMIAKDFSEQWHDAAPRVTQLQDHNYENLDGESLRFACVQLLAQRQKRKVLFVMSDGSPVSAEPSHIQTIQRTYVHEVVSEMRGRGVEIVGIGIQSNSVRTYYKPTYVIVNKLEELPSVTLNQMKFLLLGQEKRRR